MLALERSGDRRAGIVGRLIRERERLIGALLLGNNLVNILASALATSLLPGHLRPGRRRLRDAWS